MIRDHIKYYSALLLLLFPTGCATVFHQPMKPSEARLGEYSGFHKELTMMPEPAEKIVVAVYKFRDQTGQYKPTESGASWSTAVTQGATSILLESLEESGWFVPIEREGLSNLLNERRIIRSSREQYQAETGENQSMLPPLLFGGVMIEGGIISYETNILTGGAGVRYFGTGVNGEYREDKVTIYLRAVSTSNGRILKTVHTSKTILSQKLDIGVFRFVSLKKLLEAETGYTYNEPSQIAVQEAIDKAVHALVMEGILDKLWSLKDSADMNSPVIKNYVAEKQENNQTDYLGFVSKQRRNTFSAGATGGLLFYDGDYTGTKILPGATLGIGFQEKKPVSYHWTLGAGMAGAENKFTSNASFSDLSVQYRFFNRFSSTPFVRAGMGVMYYSRKHWFYEDPAFNKTMAPYWFAEAGYEFLAGKRLGIYVAGDYIQLLNDSFDEKQYGKYNDRIWSVKLGINYYFNLFNP